MVKPARVGLQKAISIQKDLLWLASKWTPNSAKKCWQFEDFDPTTETCYEAYLFALLNLDPMEEVSPEIDTHSKDDSNIPDAPLPSV